MNEIDLLLQLGPHRCAAFVIDLDVDDVGLAAYGAILDILLPLALRQVDRDDDLLAARAADVTRFVVHGVTGPSARVR